MTSKFNLVNDPIAFAQLIQNKSVACDKKGNFYVENRLIATIRRFVAIIFGDLFGLESRKHIGWAKGLIYTFDQIEKRRIELYQPQFLSHLSTAKRVKKILKQSKSLNAKAALHQLNLRTTALKYRQANAYHTKYVKNQQPNTQLFNQIKPLAEAWKKKQIVYKTHELSEKESQQLEILTQYPKFAALVMEDSPWLEKFFGWALLEKNNVDAFVQFPKTVQKIIDIGLSEKIGKYGGEDLKIENVNIAGTVYKDLTLPFEGKRESILDKKHHVTLINDYMLSIKEIFKIYKDRKTKVGNVEYFGEGKGTCNWNGIEWGTFNPKKNDYDRIDVKDPEWIKKIPFSEIITEDEAKERFEDKNGNKLQFEPNHWVFSVIAKNEYKHANLTGTHTMLCIAVPLGNGRRGLCYMSKFPCEFPDFEKEKRRVLRLGFDTVDGAIQLPDENFYRIKRDEENVSWRATEKDAQIVLNRIAKDKLLIEKRLFHFQILIYNCTDWVFKKLRHMVPVQERDEIASMSMWEAEPEGLAAKIIKLPPFIRKIIFDISIKIASPVGKIKIRKDKTEYIIQLTTKNGPWNDGVRKPHPAMIIIRKRQNKEKVLKANLNPSC